MTAARLWWVALAAMACAVVAPLLVVEAPPLLDYLNHLARIEVLALGGRDPVLSRMLAPAWSIVPNLGLDLLLTPALRVLPALPSGRVAVGIILLLPLIGSIAYSRAVFRVRSWWPLGAGLVTYNATVLLGFLNFQASIGAALLMAAYWVRAGADRLAPGRVAICSIGAVGLFFCHLMGLVLFLVLAGAFEFDALLRRGRERLPRLAGLAVVAIIPAMLYAASPFGRAGGPDLWMPVADKARQLLVPFVSYDPALDALTACIVALCVLRLATLGACRLPRHAAMALLALLVLYAASPFIAKGTCFLDTRFAIMLGYLLFAAIMPEGVSRTLAVTVGVTLGALFVVRVGIVCAVWHGYQRDIDGMRAVIAAVPAGARVYVTNVDPEEAPDYWRGAPRRRMLSNGVRADYHLAALLLLERHAFWPFLFADPAQQPIAWLPPYDRIAANSGPLLAHRQVPMSASRLLCDYEFLLLLDAGGEPAPARYGAGRLTLLRAEDAAALYRVGRPAGAACAAAGPP